MLTMQAVYERFDKIGCATVCTFDAIQPGEKYSIRGNRCDECGNCYTACPVHAIRAKGE